MFFVRIIINVACAVCKKSVTMHGLVMHYIDAHGLEPVITGILTYSFED